jgi:hypothetical protein
MREERSGGKQDVYARVERKVKEDSQRKRSSYWMAFAASVLDQSVRRHRGFKAF